MKNKIPSAIVFSLLTLIAIPILALNSGYGEPIEGEWILNISGNDKGVAIITFLPDNIFEGYGLTLGIGVPLIINGSYEIDIKGKINGNLTIKDWETEDILGSGNFTGRINKEKTKLSLKILDIPIILNGIRLLEEPEIPENWSVKITGGIKGTILPLNIKPLESEEDGKIFKRTYMISGTVTLQNGESFFIGGGFILDHKNIAYGVYEVFIPEGEEKIDDGVFSGKINLQSGKFSWKAKSIIDGSKFNLKGEILH